LGRHSHCQTSAALTVIEPQSQCVQTALGHGAEIMRLVVGILLALTISALTLLLVLVLFGVR
jgi:hypothetical protein